jgi:arginine exporter protein ArgO
LDQLAINLVKTNGGLHLGVRWPAFFGLVRLAFGARAASRFMAKPVFWKVLDLVIAAVMFGIAILLAFYTF